MKCIRFRTSWVINITKRIIKDIHLFHFHAVKPFTKLRLSIIMVYWAHKLFRQETLQSILQQFHLNRLCQKVIEAKLHVHLSGTHYSISRQDNNDCILCFWICTYLSCNLGTIHIWHHIINKHNVKMLPVHEGKCLCTSAYRHNIHSITAHKARRNLEVDWIIIDYKYFSIRCNK